MNETNNFFARVEKALEDSDGVISFMARKTTEPEVYQQMNQDEREMYTVLIGAMALKIYKDINAKG